MMYAQDEIYLICHNLVLKELRDKKDKEAKDKDEKDQKILQEYNEILADVEKIRQENKDPHLWNEKS